jgi:hypothetical protein
LNGEGRGFDSTCFDVQVTGFGKDTSARPPTSITCVPRRCGAPIGSRNRAAASRCIARTPQFAACHGVRALAGDAMGRLEATRRDLKAYRDAVPGELPQGPGSYPGKDPPKLLSDWLKPIQRELGLL